MSSGVGDEEEMDSKRIGFFFVNIIYFGGLFSYSNMHFMYKIKSWIFIKKVSQKNKIYIIHMLHENTQII